MICGHCKNKIYDGQSFKTINGKKICLKCILSVHAENAFKETENMIFGHNKACIVCGNIHNVHKHHIIPVAHQGGDRKNLHVKDTIPLCHNCHLYMSPFIRRLGYHGFNTYSIKEANKICLALNKKTNYEFRVKTFVKHYKTVKSKTFVTIEFVPASHV